jgi:hypothetical protein
MQRSSHAQHCLPITPCGKRHPTTLAARLPAGYIARVMTQPTSDPTDAARFRRTLSRVMFVQVATLILLWLLQSRYSI